MYRRKPMYLAVFIILFALSAKAYAVPYLGVVLRQPSDCEYGAAIEEVIDGSPAAKAKLAEGDIVVVVNGTNITSAGSLFGTILSLKAGDEIKVKIRRDGEKKTLTVTLGERPKRRNVFPSKTMIGIRLVERPSGKVVVTAIVPGHAAEIAKIMPGDVIFEFDGTKITSGAQLARQVRKKKAGDKVSIKIERGGETIVKKVILTQWWSPRAI